MPSPDARFRRHFLSWDRPWLPQVAGWLARDWRGHGPLDLSNVLAVVPTRQSARRLREALAELAHGRDAAVFAPRTLTPDALLGEGGAGPDVASRLEALLAWTEVLREVDLDTVPDVFPVAPPRRDFAWAWRMAENLFRLQTQLTEGGLALAGVADAAGENFPERERWRQLGQLETRQEERLAMNGRRESHAARRAFARAPALPPGVERIVVLAVLDPLPLAIDVLRTWAETVPVDVVVFAPPAEAERFDFAGRPVPAAWERRTIEIPEFARRVQVCADPAAEAERAARVAIAYGRPEGFVAFGVADPDVLPLLENELSRAGLASYNPEGEPRRSGRLFALLAALAALAREASFEAVATLARCPDFLLGLQAREGREFSPTRFLAELDDLRAEHLPADLDAATAFMPVENSGVARGLGFIRELRDRLVAGEFPANATAALEAIFAARRFELHRPEDADAVEAAEAWRDVIASCAALAAQFAALRNAEWWDVALALFGDGRSAEEKAPEALELQGWLELLWEDAPHLVVTGLNDGLVPDAIVGDPFLPESLRERLGLKTNAARFARDACLLQALAASRRTNGRLELLLARNSAAGDPLRPSRLLLRCPDEQLPGRIARLFRPVAALRPNLAWTRAWKLRPRREPPPTRVPVTGLRTWLACPFRFYLTHVLRMEAVEPGKTEMDAFDFGTLCHAALEAMGREAALRDCTDERTLRDFLLAELERATRLRYGEHLTLPLVVQLESARQRLGKVAAVQARERAEGWVIERVESPFTLELHGLAVRGKVDRVDRHEATGAWRVLDYKTSDTAVPPARSHLRPARAEDVARPAWMRTTYDEREYVWADLQLPVYLRALARELPPGAALGCGYINLPKAAGETALAPWPELAGELLAAAAACTDGVVEKIRAGEFWPPAELDPERDAFAALFHHGAEESVAWEVER